MKKILKLLFIFTLVFAFFAPMQITPIKAAETKAVIYCSRFMGKHRAQAFAMGNIYSLNGKTKRNTDALWGAYKCPCGQYLFVEGHPEVEPPYSYLEVTESTIMNNTDVKLNIVGLSFALYTNREFRYNKTSRLASYSFTS